MKYSNQTWCVHLLFSYLSPLSKAYFLLPGKYSDTVSIWRRFGGKQRDTISRIDVEWPKTICLSPRNVWKYFSLVFFSPVITTFVSHCLHLGVPMWESSIYWHCVVNVFRQSPHWDKWEHWVTKVWHNVACCFQCRRKTRSRHNGAFLLSGW